MKSVKQIVFAAVAVAMIGCDSGGTSGSVNSGAAAGNTANASACYQRIQESLSSYGTPDEIRENSITFDDGSIMLIEEHVYNETRLVRSFGHKVEEAVCNSWEEGLTI